MKRTLVALLVVGALITLTVLGACIVGAGAVAPRILGAGPDGIELRPTPGEIESKAALPAEIAGYARAECHSLGAFQGVPLGPEAVEAIYTGSGGSVRVIVAKLRNDHEAAALVAELAARLEDAGVLDSYRLLAEEPFEGWWSASGKRNFAYWHAPDWATDQHGFVWQNGRWCFVVASNAPVARRDVTLNFPY